MLDFMVSVRVPVAVCLCVLASAYALVRDGLFTCPRVGGHDGAGSQDQRHHVLHARPLRPTPILLLTLHCSV